MDYFLNSERLGFRHWTADDQALAIGLWCDAQVTALIGGPWSQDVALARLAQEVSHGQQLGVQYWPVFLLEDGSHVGCAGLRPYKLEEKIFEMGIHLRPGFWGRGFAYEAARAIVPYAFSSLPIDALITGHHPRNTASRRLLNKLGFTFLEERVYAPTGLMHPMYLLRKEQAIPSQGETR
ncbi:MAG: GNAT family N-acetyltransferase [Terracidiphilus sp.]